MSFLRCTLVATACALAVGLSLRLTAADELGLFAEFAAADASLNETYQRVIAALPPATRESLRRAQRAWIAFMDKDVDAIMPISTVEQRWGMKLEETIARRKELEAMSKPPATDEARLRSQLQNADRELNEAYRKSLAVFRDDAAGIREAQRAWITYRDENARACKTSEMLANVSLTTQRAAQLRKFFGSRTDLADDQEQASPQIAKSVEALPPGHKIPDPFERAKK